MTCALPSTTTGNLHAMQHDGFSDDTSQDQAPQAPHDGQVTAATPSTAHPAVDAVLASLADLDSRPVSEHVGVFERAHESLRSALDAPAAQVPDEVPPASPEETTAVAGPGESPSRPGGS